MRLHQIALVVVVICAVAVSASAPVKRKSLVKAPVSRCDANHVEVANSLCCPKSHPVLIDGECFEHCHEDSDDMTLGAWVGCRELCDGGYSSSINSCSNGILTSERKDHPRHGVAAVAQRSVPSDPSAVISTCPKGYVTVSRVGGAGGCCPKDKPKLIAGKCYGGCAANRDELVIGRFVACRAQCPDGYDTTNNECQKAHEDSVSRGDFPRDGVVPTDRVVAPAPSNGDNVGCPSGYVGASKRYCCPATDPVLKGLLCYARCKTGYEEAGYGCRKLCKPGYSQSTLQCGKGGQSYQREGYERSPKPLKMRA